LWDNGDPKGARDLAHRLAAWTSAAFIESNPIPAKAALAMMGRIENVLRLPLVPLKDSYADAVRQALRSAGALSE
ncbi:MAG TPA: dihydrodipicolinate synthase family protein, partial [Gemmatimonadaceae bacterium]|nr:dihydrodipicolinate synthase family protein [Gemmatimonadaceae bacterium]